MVSAHLAIDVPADALRPLLDRLAHMDADAPSLWEDWMLTPVGGGWNNRLYHATNGTLDLAVKFTRRDERSRAAREYEALKLLSDLDLDLAPKAVDFDTRSSPIGPSKRWMLGNNRPPGP